MEINANALFFAVSGIWMIYIPVAPKVASWYVPKRSTKRQLGSMLKARRVGVTTLFCANMAGHYLGLGFSFRVYGNRLSGGISIGGDSADFFDATPY